LGVVDDGHDRNVSACANLSGTRGDMGDPGKGRRRAWVHVADDEWEACTDDCPGNPAADLAEPDHSDGRHKSRN
jgi:hypothetical protein